MFGEERQATRQNARYCFLMHVRFRLTSSRRPVSSLTEMLCSAGGGRHTAAPLPHSPPSNSDVVIGSDSARMRKLRKSLRPVEKTGELGCCSLSHSN
ncbi:hypothetical protein E2C01_035962 [Portunus trituberculatus]|uniref:Uncharacterized protein n=1 Tax=Portunus trituberculatus TaxID=210409 RepID=A0A5B7F7D8_PORTR|nr:hypothetical protein [Portunus trituberculatus]